MPPRQNRIQIIKYAPPPTDLPVYGSVDSSQVSFVGRTNYVASLEEKKFIFGLKRVDRRRHVYILGKSGVGKTKLMELSVRQDIAYGHGVCVIDPDGQLVDDVLNFIPEERIDDVCVIDPSDINFPASFNPLENVDTIFKYQLAQGFVEALTKQFASNWTPRLEHLFRFTILALLDYPDATMRGVILMLTNQKYRQIVIPYIQDDMVKKFWAVEFADWSEKFETDVIIPLVSKLGQFLSNPMIKNIFSQKTGKISMDELIKQQKIILVYLSKDKIGEENSDFLGALFLIKIKQAGMARALLDATQKNDFYLYLDEFQHVLTDTLENILAESRKYGVSLTMAHQYMAQLSPKLQRAVLGNVGTIISFRVGGEDAVTLRPEFAPVFDIKDMINLGIGEFYIKTVIDGESYDPFSAESLKVLSAPYPSNKERIMKASREAYAVTVAEAQQMIDKENLIVDQQTIEEPGNTPTENIDGLDSEQIAENVFEDSPLRTQ